jgi:hypothetical protein
MINENQHKLLAKENVQQLIKAFDAEPVDLDHFRRASIHQRVESWFSELDKKYEKTINEKNA